MKPINLAWGVTLIIALVVGLYLSGAIAAPQTPALPKADHAGVRADKVMNGITDITVDMVNSETNTQQRVMLQCDATTASLNVFYYMNNVLGEKAKGASNFRITVYGNGEDGFHPGGDAVLFDSAKAKNNLRDGLLLANKLQGKGYIGFEFYTVEKGKEAAIAQSLLLPSTYAADILKAANTIQGSGGCDIDGGFTTVYPLKNLTDQI